MSALELKELYSRLEIPQNVIYRFAEVCKDIDMVEIINLFYRDEDKFFEFLDENYKEKYLETLYIYINLALKLYDQYIEKGIDLKIYFDTIDDIRIWALNCLKETNQYGLKEIYWINEHLRMRIFKLGRLQFQKRESTEFKEWVSTQLNIDKDYFYFIHIPEGERLSYESVLDSYRQAKEFYKDDMIFAAESWMLSDKLDELLGSESNIVKLKNDYIILSKLDDVNPIKRYLKQGSPLALKVEQLENEGVLIGEGFGVCLKYR